MSDAQTPDIAKIIGLIMNNPQLIAEISRLAAESEETDSPPQVAEAVENEIASPVAAPIFERPRGNASRSQLLCALKPYVSPERAKAIDSMISIADILDMMKAR